MFDINRWMSIPLILLFLFSCQSSPEELIKTEKLFTLLSPSETGVDFQNTVVETEEDNHLIDDMIVSGAGVGVGDINNDGLPDLYFTGNQVPNKLYLNQGEMVFEDITEQAGIASEKPGSSGVTFADVNNDGYLDIYISKYVFEESQLSKNLLYINNGDLTFSEMAAEYGLADRGYSVQATFFDFDLDGLLDLYLINQPPYPRNRFENKVTLPIIKSQQCTDRLYRNTGEYFVDITDNARVRNLAFGLAAIVGDFNNDGYPDIYVANDYDRPDHLYINQGGQYFRNTINQSMKHMSNSSMGTDVADFNNDGLLDIVVVDMVAEDNKRIKTKMGGMDRKTFREVVENGGHHQYMFNTLQRNNGNNTFSELAHLAGVSNTDWSWSALFADFDNDGWKDLFVTNGIKRAMRKMDLHQEYSKVLDSLELSAEQIGKKIGDIYDVMEFVEMAKPEKLDNYIFENNGDLTFTKRNRQWGMNIPTLSFGAAYADLDLDGDIDLIVNNTDDYAHIFQNNTMENEIGNYLRIALENEQGSPAYGAKVSLFMDGTFWQVQELTNVRGYKSKSEDILHFGLGKNEVIDEIHITWPGGKTLVKKNVSANQLIKLGPSKAKDEKILEEKGPRLFHEATRKLNLKYSHRENDYDDYQKEMLLPYKRSNFGPGLAVGDVNSNGFEDFYIGGASGYAGVLFVQKNDGTFDRSTQNTWENEKVQEDLGAEFFDSDNDGDLDLYVVSGGNEFEPGSEKLQDRLYLNDGSGQFQLAPNRLPEMHTSGSRVFPADYDLDGDLDLFVGGRLVPGKYPLPARSYILRNEGGRFLDVTSEIAPELITAGLVTSAAWTDFNGDGNLDLALVGEWMAVTLMENRNGKFHNVTEESGLEKTTGWYYAIVSEDFDQDGDDDFVVGNLGLNFKYKASPQEPFEIYSYDFDNNGRLDMVFGYHQNGELFPLSGRMFSIQQVPQLGQKFPTNESFGNANLRDVYGPMLDQALNYKARTFSSSYIENLGDGTFKVRDLPNEAQISSINNILAYDFNLDGHLDILISGNLFPVEIETPRNDAGIGLYLTGDGEGNFTPIPLTESGFFAPYDAKDMKMITVGKEQQPQQVILVANNKQWLQAIQYHPERIADFNRLLSLK